MLNGAKELTEEEKKALRGSKFAPLPFQPSSSRPQPRIPHPGGPVATNKAVALAKFLERKLQEPGGLDSLNPSLVESAVQKAKETVNACRRTSDNGLKIRHVSSFDDPEYEDTSSEESLKPERKRLKKEKKEKKKEKNKQKKKKKNKKLKGKAGYKLD